MKTIYTLVILSFSLSITAQNQPPNPGFEDWENVGTPTEEPEFWSSIKTSDDSILSNLAPKVMSRSGDAHSGMYSVMLEAVQVFVTANGIITNGRVHASIIPDSGYVFTDTSGPGWNTPFGDQPDSLVGWFKCDPQNGDRGKIEMIMHQTTNGSMPVRNNLMHRLGHARYDFPTTTVTTWTRFSVPVNHIGISTADYILFVITSGDSTIAVDGSKLWIDDIELIYNSTGITPDTYLHPFVYTDGQSVIAEMPVNQIAKIELFNISGQQIWQWEGTGKIKSPELGAQGFYIYRIKVGKKAYTGKISITNH